ncbi:hypothetical protein [Xiamenia xianingshaonis]|uniref:Uncharacterized protein n=1 Tax=Xiamenia xianingshaonis TaxID=2682776 RepID=A0A9E6SU01_9ACTN|nr:hypothetical protein [Xiamenia xianingshaonis]NHM14099.1 hypothetical protein [Xiamenia xianingshaonis]NHM16268.1 hypothetical protein [Xiamenia xianingshaonis]QTU83963.1 hypothetical protein J7S26_06230 [Xiamenia xianingshaonis]
MTRGNDHTSQWNSHASESWATQSARLQRRAPHASRTEPQEWGGVKGIALETAEDRVRLRAKATRKFRVVVACVTAVAIVAVVGGAAYGISKAVGLDKAYSLVQGIVNPEAAAQGEEEAQPAGPEDVTLDAAAAEAEAEAEAAAAAEAEAAAAAEAEAAKEAEPTLPLSYSDVTTEDESTYGIWTPWLMETNYEQSEGQWYAVGAFAYDFLTSYDQAVVAQFSINSSDIKLEAEGGEMIEGDLVLHESPVQGQIITRAPVDFEGAYAEQPLREAMKGYVLEGLIQTEDGQVIKRTRTFA